MELFQQFFKLLPLVRVQLFADFLMHILHDGAKLRRNEFPKIVIVLLSVGNDFFNRPVLLRREVQHVVKLRQKLPAQHVPVRHRQVRIVIAGRVMVSRMRVINVIHQQTAGHNARAENYDGGQNDFPGIHCA